MSNMIKNAASVCKNLEITKHYDYKTEIKCKKNSFPCFSVHMKGDFTVSPLDILICAAVLAGMCAVCGIAKRSRRKKSK